MKGSRTILKHVNFILILVFVGFNSCRKEKLKDEKGILIGKWNWIYTEHSFGWCQGEADFETINPAMDGNSYSVEFKERGKLIFIKNNTSENKYCVIFDQFVNVTQSTYAFNLNLDNNSAKSISGQVSEDTLWIKYPYVEDNPNCENYLNFFVRE